MNPSKRIIVALDTPDLEKADRLVGDLKGVVSFFKVGFELFTAHGWNAVERVKRSGARVFLDLKLHDIPNTVARTMAVLCAHDIDMTTLHTLGGGEMLLRAREARDKHCGGAAGPRLLGVTILTSHSEEKMQQELGIMRGLDEQVDSLAALARQSGLNGIVCSPLEVTSLRAKHPTPFLFVTPGVRPASSDKGDQARVVTPGKAVAAGADFLVIGRPVTEAQDPLAQAESIISSLG